MNAPLKNLLLVAFLIVSTLTLHAQMRVEGQFAGSNVLGFSINTGYDFSLGDPDSSSHKLTPTFGIGMPILTSNQPTTIFHYGINYTGYQWGFGVEASHFTRAPFSKQAISSDLKDMWFFYPNFNYLIESKKNPNRYYRISGGVYAPFTRSVDSETGERSPLKFEQDMFPGVGFCMGLKL